LTTLQQSGVELDKGRPDVQLVAEGIKNNRQLHPGARRIQWQEPELVDRGYKLEDAIR